MAWTPYTSDQTPFPTPYRCRDLYYPNAYQSYRAYPNDIGTRPGGASRPIDLRGHKSTAALSDKSLKTTGDLGWTLDYATAWCYKHLVGNQPEIADVIDNVRELGAVEPRTPFVIFDYLDRALFGHKLKGMVYLRWKTQASCSAGTTSAPGVVGIPRICIELNKMPFNDDEGDMDELLDALIHHMVHAYFLVACGPQKKGAKQDGRLMDGLHFGVILFTIKDITKQCRQGPLELIFHAIKRRNLAGQPAVGPNLLTWPGAGVPGSSRSGQNFISIDPRGSAVGPAPADGQTHCMHDNRKISWHQMKNWQVEEYSRALELEMDSKGDEVYDLKTDGKLSKLDRLEGPPSATYAELIWDGKRIMVPREKTSKFKSVKKPLEKEGKYELKMPDCSFEIFKCIYDFVLLGGYWKDREEKVHARGATGRAGPPSLVGTPTTTTLDLKQSILTHVQVFKGAESIKFEELQEYALKRLWNMPTASDDPLTALRELYNDAESSSKPIHAELHRWARAFLVQPADAVVDPQAHLYAPSASYAYGLSNLEKIREMHPEAFDELYYRNKAFQDDAKLASDKITLRSSGGSSSRGISSWPMMTGGLGYAPSSAYPQLAAHGAPPILPPRVAPPLHARPLRISDVEAPYYLPAGLRGGNRGLEYARAQARAWPCRDPWAD